MKSAIFTLLLVTQALCALAQPPGDNNSSYPTKLESLLHRIGTVVNTSTVEVGSVEGQVLQPESNTLTVVIRTEVISNADTKAKEYGVALQMRHAQDWRSKTTYVDYDELDGLVAAINKILLLQPELPAVQAKYETRGGLIVVTYSTEKREVLGRLTINNDETSWLKMSLDNLREFRDFIITAKGNLDLLKATK